MHGAVKPNGIPFALRTLRPSAVSVRLHPCAVMRFARIPRTPTIVRWIADVLPERFSIQGRVCVSFLLPAVANPPNPDAQEMWHARISSAHWMVSAAIPNGMGFAPPPPLKTAAHVWHLLLPVVWNRMGQVVRKVLRAKASFVEEMISAVRSNGMSFVPLTPPKNAVSARYLPAVWNRMRSVVREIPHAKTSFAKGMIFAVRPNGMWFVPVPPSKHAVSVRPSPQKTLNLSSMKSTIKTVERRQPNPGEWPSSKPRSIVVLREKENENG